MARDAGRACRNLHPRPSRHESRGAPARFAGSRVSPRVRGARGCPTGRGGAFRHAERLVVSRCRVRGPPAGAQGFSGSFSPAAERMAQPGQGERRARSHDLAEHARVGLRQGFVAVMALHQQRKRFGRGCLEWARGDQRWWRRWPQGSSEPGARACSCPVFERAGVQHPVVVGADPYKQGPVPHLWAPRPDGACASWATRLWRCPERSPRFGRPGRLAGPARPSCARRSAVIHQPPQDRQDRGQGAPVGGREGVWARAAARIPRAGRTSGTSRSSSWCGQPPSTVGHRQSPRGDAPEEGPPRKKFGGVAQPPASRSRVGSPGCESGGRGPEGPRGRCPVTAASRDPTRWRASGRELQGGRPQRRSQARPSAILFPKKNIFFPPPPPPPERWARPALGTLWNREKKGDGAGLSCGRLTRARHPTGLGKSNARGARPRWVATGGTRHRARSDRPRWGGGGVGARRGADTGHDDEAWVPVGLPARGPLRTFGGTGERGGSDPVGVAQACLCSGRQICYKGLPGRARRRAALKEKPRQKRGSAMKKTRLSQPFVALYSRRIARHS